MSDRSIKIEFSGYKKKFQSFFRGLIDKIYVDIDGRTILSALLGMKMKENFFVKYCG